VMNPRISLPAPIATACEAKPSADQPGTLREQFESVDLFLSNPARAHNREAAWELARRLAIQHARRTA